MLLAVNKPKKGKKMTTKTIAILATVGLHVVLGLGLALKGIVPKKDEKPEITAEILGPPEEQVQKVEKRTVKKQIEQVVAAAPPMSQVLRSDAVALTAVPEMTNLANTPIGLGQGNLGVGFGSARSRNMGKGAMFFGQQVSGNMGVVFDISGSMSVYVSLVVDEIMRSLRTATVVCANNAQLRRLRGALDVIPYDESDLSRLVQRPTLSTDAARQMHDDLKSLPNGWLLHRTENSLGAGIEYLIDEDVDTIFVFSDFGDQIIPEYVTELTEKAASAGVKVNIHVLEVGPGQERMLEALCKRTRGKYEVGELLRRARR